MTPILDSSSGAFFAGSIDDDVDLAAAAAIATSCAGYDRDEDDECYVEGDDPNCFNCRGRRWTPGGFTCMRGLLAG
jgi:hypothetical protein